MRITESRMMELAASQVSQARDKAAQAQETLSSGIRVERPSDDVASWAAGERAAVRQSMSDDRGKAISLSLGSLQQTDGALSSLSNSISQLGAIATQGATGTLSADDRTALANQVRALHDSALQVLNQKGPDGTYILSGSKGDIASFSATGVYQGDATARTVDVAEGQSAAGAVTGSGLTSAGGGVDVLSVFDQLATALDNNDSATVQSLLPTIGQAVQQVSSLRSTVGERMSALQGADDARQSFEINLASQHAAAVETDPVTAASNLTKASTVLQSARTAAEQILSMLQGS